MFNLADSGDKDHGTAFSSSRVRSTTKSPHTLSLARLRHRARGGVRHPRLPRYLDAAIDEGLTGHPIALCDIRVAEVLPLFRLDRVGVLNAAFDLASARAANATAAFERNAALLSYRDPQ